MTLTTKTEDHKSTNLEFRAMKVLNKLQKAQQELQQHYESYGSISIPCLVGLQARREILKIRIERCIGVLGNYITKNNHDRSSGDYGKS